MFFYSAKIKTIVTGYQPVSATLSVDCPSVRVMRSYSRRYRQAPDVGGVPDGSRGTGDGELGEKVRTGDDARSVALSGLHLSFSGMQIDCLLRLTNVE